jgi:hypothetical protein
MEQSVEYKGYDIIRTTEPDDSAVICEITNERGYVACKYSQDPEAYSIEWAKDLIDNL